MKINCINCGRCKLVCPLKETVLKSHVQLERVWVDIVKKNQLLSSQHLVGFAYTLSSQFYKEWWCCIWCFVIQKKNIKKHRIYKMRKLLNNYYQTRGSKICAVKKI